MKLFESLNSALEFIGFQLPHKGERPVAGGCINSCFLISDRKDHSVFIKSNDKSRVDMFAQEARGLIELERISPLKVPEPLALAKEGGRSYLILHHIKSSVKSNSFWIDFGRALAEQHLAGNSEKFGFYEDNYIGSTKQINSNEDNWISFFAQHRIFFQAKLALTRRLLDSSLMTKVEGLIDRLDRYITEPHKPQLLHGDLWSGNFMVGPKGEPWIIDPACYYGHGEADLAMTEMFGGYPESFYSAYREIIPLDSGYRDRRDIYNLYHYLNHLNLFGSSYYSSVKSIVQRYS